MAGEKSDVFIDIVADNEQLKRKLAEADARIAQLQSKANQADSGGLGFKQSVTAVTQWIGKVTAAIGIATTFYNLGLRIRETWEGVFSTGAEKAARFADSIDFSKPEKATKDLDEQIQALESRLDAAKGGEKGGWFANLITGDTPAKLQAEIDDLRKRREKAFNEATGDVQNQASKRLEALLKSQGVEKIVDEEARIIAEGNAKVAKLRDDFKGPLFERNKQMLDEAIRNENEITQNKLSALGDRQAKEAEAERKANEDKIRRDREAAQRRAAELDRVMRDTQRGQTQQFGDFDLNGLTAQAQLDFWNYVAPTIIRNGGGR